MRKYVSFWILFSVVNKKYLLRRSAKMHSFWLQTLKALNCPRSWALYLRFDSLQTKKRVSPKKKLPLYIYLETNCIITIQYVDTVEVTAPNSPQLTWKNPPACTHSFLVLLWSNKKVISCTTSWSHAYCLLLLIFCKNV